MADDANVAAACEEREREALIRRIRDRVRPAEAPVRPVAEREQ